MNNKRKATFYALFCVALWALIPVVAKLGQLELDHHQFLFWSSLVSFLVLFLTVVFTGKFSVYKTYSAKDWFYFCILGLLGTYLYYLLLYFGYARAEGMEVLVVQYSWPIIIVALSVFILKEKLTVKKIISIILGFAGVIVVLSKGDLQNIEIKHGDVIMLVGAGSLCFALFSVLSKGIKQEPLGVVSIYFFSACSASYLSMLWFSEFTIPSIKEITPILLNGILVNGFSYILWLLALKNAQASYVAPFTFITPILSAIYLIAFFNAPFYSAYAIGLALVVIGGLVNTLKEK